MPNHQIGTDVLVSLVKSFQESADRARKKEWSDEMWVGYRTAMDEAAYRLEDMICKASNHYAK